MDSLKAKKSPGPDNLQKADRTHLSNVFGSMKLLPPQFTEIIILLPKKGNKLNARIAGESQLLAWLIRELLI